MSNQNLEKASESLFIMAVMFILGFNFDITHRNILNFFLLDFTRFSLDTVLNVIWFVLLCVSLISSVFGTYLYLNKGKINNLYLYICLVLNMIQVNILGTELSWSYGIKRHVVWYNSGIGYGIRISGFEFLLFIWYLIIVKRNKPKENIHG